MVYIPTAKIDRLIQMVIQNSFVLDIDKSPIY